MARMLNFMRVKGYNLYLTLLSTSFLAVMLFSSISFASSSYKMPADIDHEGKYLFYLHGSIIETKGPDARHPKYGKYEYFSILEAFEEGGFITISEVRSANTNKKEYASKITNQIVNLITAGVPPRNITVVGFSKGGSIALYTALYVMNPEVNYVVLAGCGQYGKFRQGYNIFLQDAAGGIQGRILSIFDNDDNIVGSYKRAFALSHEGLSSKEIVINTGRGHGAFYKVRKEWVAPIFDWSFD
jgi:hypothetical protein